MLTSPRLSEEPKELQENINLQNEHELDYSETSSESSSIENALEECSSNEPVGNFGNIIVKDSSDVHFGNKTFYQGPVIIKQFLYNNSASDTPTCSHNEHSNPALVNDSVSTERVNDGVINLVNNSENEFPDNSASNEGSNTCWTFICKYKRTALCFVFFVNVIIILTIYLTLTINNPGTSFLNGSDSDEDESAPLPRDLDTLPVSNGKLRIIPRGQWIAQPAVSAPNKLKTPVPYVIILHTATEYCSDISTCIYRVRNIQSYHIDDKHWLDIAYNFLVGGDGLVYEGRGWNKEGANVHGYNWKAIGIAFIGTFTDTLPSPGQLLAAKQLIEKGVEKGIIQRNYKMLAHCQLSVTKSPGFLLYEEIKKWPHWVKSPNDNCN